MSNKFLGQFLLEKGIITPQQLLTALELQKEFNPSLGQLAVKQGYIDNDAANKINLEQQRTDQRFGDLAISLGYMDNTQVDELFNVQQSTRKFFGEILVEQGFIDHATLEAELSEHKALKQQAELELDNAINNHQHQKLITNTLQTFVKSFTRIPKIPTQVSGVLAGTPKVSDDHYVVSQRANMVQTFKIGMVAPSELMKVLGTNFLGFDTSANEALYTDAVSELLNIILGNVLVINGEQQTELSPPQVERNGDDITEGFNQCFAVEMSAGGHDFSIFFMYND